MFEDTHSPRKRNTYIYIYIYIKYRMIKKSVQLMITIHKFTSMFKVSGGQGDTKLTLTPSVIPNSNYLIMVGD